MTTNTTSNTRSVTVALKDVVLDHARLGKPYTPNFAEGADKPQWSVMIRADDGTEAFDALIDLKEAGLPVNLDDATGQLTLNLKQYTHTVKGRKNSIGVFDADFNELDEATASTVGNGSRGNVVFYYYGYANANGVGYTARLTDVQVTEKVEFTPESKEERLKRLFG